MKFTSKQLLALLASIFVMAGSQAFGQGGIALDFSTDPEDRGVEFFGSAEWRESGGVENTGYLSVTDAVNSERGAIIFPDLADGQALTSFQISADLRVGNGTASPADGFSFNLVTPEDPLLLDEGEGYAGGPNGEANLPEEGSTTGLGIGFDEWQSGDRDPNANATDADGNLLDPIDPTCPDTVNDDGAIGWDCIGMSIRVDNVLLGQAGFPTLNGDLFDDSSLQTGPRGEGLEALGWAKLIIRVTQNEDDPSLSNLFVSYKDRTVFDQEIEYTPAPGQLVFGGRTGGSNSTHDIDNISIVTDFQGITLGDFNKDDSIDLDDYAILLSNMDTGDQDTSFESGDINFTGNVDLSDFAEFRRVYAAANPDGPPLSAVPEPTTLSMIAFGLLGLMIRRRRG